MSLKSIFMEVPWRRTGAGRLPDLGFFFLSLLPLTRMYKHPEAVHIQFVGNDQKRGGKNYTYIKNALQFAACTRFSAGSERIYSELSYHIMNRNTATHLQFSVLFNFYILLIWLLLLMRTSVYIRVLLVKRTRRRTDGKTFVNIIMRQCRKFSGYFHTLC